MRVVCSSILPKSPKDIFDLLVRGDTIVKLTDGFPISYEDAELPEYWHEGEPINLKPRFFGLSQGDHFMTFKQIDRDQLLLYTEEYGTGIKRWDHTMELKPLSHGRCQYTDIVNIKAGVRTLIVWFIAKRLYAHRHDRLHSLLSHE